MIRFLLDGEVRTLADCDPTQTVLEWLRNDQKRTGTKEGCAEGDCGACTVVVGELIGDAVRYRAVNACIFFMPMLNGRELLTVESLGSSAALHPVQQALADNDGSQCGFCTPGFVMSMFARYQNTDPALPESVDDVLAGNLCRCTGYGPIRRAALECDGDTTVRARFGGAATLETLQSFTDEADEEALATSFQDTLSGSRRHTFAPRTEGQLAQVLAAHPASTIVAGATDVGLWVTKQDRDLETLVFINQIESLGKIETIDGGVHIGAGVKYADALAPLHTLHPDLGELVRRIGSAQVRNSGTVGGNIANGSPIGDMPPALIALNATLCLSSAQGERVLPLEDFFLAYGKQDLKSGEYVRAVMVPAPSPDHVFRAYKISKRFDQDISAVCGAFAISLKDGLVEDARIAFGGMAGTPKRAFNCEAALIGRVWDKAAAERGALAMAADYQPLSDMRASADYRMKVAQNLLRKFLAETRQAGRTRIIGSV